MSLLTIQRSTLTFYFMDTLISRHTVVQKQHNKIRKQTQSKQLRWGHQSEWNDLKWRYVLLQSMILVIIKCNKNRRHQWQMPLGQAEVWCAHSPRQNQSVKVSICRCLGCLPDCFFTGASNFLKCLLVAGQLLRGKKQPDTKASLNSRWMFVCRLKHTRYKM